MLDTTHRIAPIECPSCHYVMDASTCVDESTAAPKEGDITICLRCATVGQFGPALEFVDITTDLGQLDEDTYVQVQVARTAILKMWASRAVEQP